MSISSKGWELAVKDAETEVKKARTVLAEMEAALAVCKSRRDSGEPFPGEAVGDKAERSGR